MTFVKGQARIGGRKKGTPNKTTQLKLEMAQREQREIAERARINGMTPLDVMLDNMRWAVESAKVLMEKSADAHARGAAPAVAAIELRLDQVKAFAQRCARDAATFLHPQLAAVKHEHRGADGELIRPVIEITGYPAALKEIAPPPPALPLAKGKH
jgi:hypothetical protein